MKITANELRRILEDIESVQHRVRDRTYKISLQFYGKKDDEYERKYKKVGTFVADDMNMRLLKDKDYQTRASLLEKLKNAVVRLDVDNADGLVECHNCKYQYECERTYLGGCTDGKEWEEDDAEEDET